jgi:integrase
VRRKPYWINVSAGVGLGYRRNLGPGSWTVRWPDGKGGYLSQAFAVADDFEDANQDQVLDFWTAQGRARELVRGTGNKPITVAEAIDDYERDLAARGGRVAQVEHLRRLFGPALMGRSVNALTVRELRRWRDARLATVTAATVTRESKTFRAALNHAANQDAAIVNRAAWTVGLAALPDSHRARTDAVLTDDEIRKIIVACYAQSDRLGLFVEVLAVTGARPIQAARLLVGDLQTDRVLIPRSAKGRGRKRIDRRPIPIPPTLVTKLRAAAADRPADAPLLQRTDGQAWRPEFSDLSRPFERALADAGLPKVVPYSLRHSSITRALLRGVPVRVVADVHDTSVAMIERNYASVIGDHSDAMVRSAQLELGPVAGDVVVPMVRRP